MEALPIREPLALAQKTTQTPSVAMRNEGENRDAPAFEPLRSPRSRLVFAGCGSSGL
jgi:hypothetical protein